MVQALKPVLLISCKQVCVASNAAPGTLCHNTWLRGIRCTDSRGLVRRNQHKQQQQQPAHQQQRAAVLALCSQSTEANRGFPCTQICARPTERACSLHCNTEQKQTGRKNKIASRPRASRPAFRHSNKEMTETPNIIDLTTSTFLQLELLLGQSFLCARRF